MKALFFFSLWLVGGFIARADSPTARAQIEAAYAKVQLAASLKFVDGMFSIRSPGFVLFDPQGAQINLNYDRIRYHRLLDDCSQVEQKVEIGSFHQVDETHAWCLRKESLRLTTPSPKGPVSKILRTESRDEWVRLPRGWRLQAAYVSLQRLMEAEH